MIDLSVGSTGRVVNNWIVQGRDKENYSASLPLPPKAKSIAQTDCSSRPTGVRRRRALDQFRR
jgi:hypothetical protein